MAQSIRGFSVTRDWDARPERAEGSEFITNSVRRGKRSLKGLEEADGDNLPRYFSSLGLPELAGCWVACVVEQLVSDRNVGYIARSLCVVAERLHGVEFKEKVMAESVTTTGRAQPIGGGGEWNLGEAPAPCRVGSSKKREAAFAEYHAANPHVWEEFERRALTMIAAGRPRYSARTIVEAIRWHFDAQTTSGDGFKINDHHSAYYARLFVAKHPEHREFFSLKGEA